MALGFTSPWSFLTESWIPISFQRHDELFLERRVLGVGTSRETGENVDQRGWEG
jgi:hypothetical protein